MIKQGEKVMPMANTSKNWWIEGTKWNSLGKTTNLNCKIIIQMLTSGCNVQRKQLSKDEELARSYSYIFGQCFEMGYIRKVDNLKECPTMCYLLHFPVICKATMIQRQKLMEFTWIMQLIEIQSSRDLYVVLTRFRKYPIALVCVVAEIYLRIVLASQDRMYHRFRWRNMDQTKQPGIFQFNSLAFGVKSAPFETQFICQEHTLKLKDVYPLAADTVLYSTYSDESRESVAD